MASIVDRHATETGKQGGKRWQVRWRNDHNKDRRKAFAKKAEAERFASQIEHELNTGDYRDPRADPLAVQHGKGCPPSTPAPAPPH